MIKKILVGFDGSDGSRCALLQACAFAKALNADLWALWARSSLPHYPETVDEVEEEQSAAEAFYHALQHDIAVVAGEQGMQIRCDWRSGHAPKTIVDYAKEGGFDLIVLGHSGHSKQWGGFLGHTPDKVSDNAHCSVLIVR